MKMFRILFSLFALTLLPMLAHGQQYELSCPSGSWPIYPTGVTVNGTNGKYRQWQCVDNNGNVNLQGVKLNPSQLNGNIIVDGINYTTISTAVNALPSCTIGANTWNHCGTVIVPPGTYTISSTMAFTSPFIWIRGSGPPVTKIAFIGATGAAIDWSASPFNAQDNTEAGGISGITIDGTGAAAGTSGLRFHDITGLHIQNIQINNFAGAGSSCLWEDAATTWTERSIVQGTLYNCTTGWKQTVQDAATGTTLGYGSFDLRINTVGAQTAVASIGGANAVDFSQNILHLAINGDDTAGSFGIALANSVWYSNGGIIHMEHEATGISTDATSTFFFPGPVDQGAITTNSFNAASHVNYFDVGAGHFMPWKIQPFTTADAMLAFGESSDCGATNAALIFCQPVGSSTDILQISHAGVVQWDFLSSSATHTTFIQPGAGASNVTTTFPADTGRLTVNIATGTSTLTNVAIGSGACATTVTTTATNVATTDTISWAYASFGAPTTDGRLIVNAWPTSGNVNFSRCNPTAGSITPSSLTINWAVRR